MSLKISFVLAMLALTPPALAQMIVEDAYARSAGPMAQSGAVFLALTNAGDTDDRIVGVLSDAAARVELHTHIADEHGIMRMRPATAGFAVAAGATRWLQRGGDHVMFMGLTAPWRHGETIALTLHFEQAAPVELRVRIDQERQARNEALPLQ